jgi:outer membrane protein assembly factor BamA
MAGVVEQGHEVPGFTVPVHRALTEPILLGGAPRAIAIMNGTLAGAVGLGLRYETPIGPLRAEYGLNPDQRPGEPEGTFHIGFGLGY